MPSAQDDTQSLKELVTKIQQFLAHQANTNVNLTEAAKESLTVASECIEQAFETEKKGPSNELLDIYMKHKQGPASGGPAAAAGAGAAAGFSDWTQAAAGLLGGANPAAGGNADPALLIQNLASTFLSNIAGGQQPRQPDQQSRVHTQSESVNTATDTSSTTDSSTAGQPQGVAAAAAAAPAPNEPRTVRKQATEAEKLAAESFKNQGNDLMKQERYKEAYDCYTQAINIDNNNAIYYSNRAAALSKLGDHQATLNDCQEAIQIDPTYSKAYGRMGLAYASMENHQKAKEAYLKAIELDPTNESYRNNLQIAQESLNATSRQTGQTGAGEHGGQNNMAEMLRSMMSNPDVVNMAMRSLQDPRMQNLFGGIFGAAGAGSQQQQQPGSTDRNSHYS